MTAFAFILSVGPLVVAAGASASACKSIGITVFSGMIASTCLAVVFGPSYFVLVQRFEGGAPQAASGGAAGGAVAAGLGRMLAPSWKQPSSLGLKPILELVEAGRSVGLTLCKSDIGRPAGGGVQ
jgi:hypothetical protein